MVIVSGNFVDLSDAEARSALSTAIGLPSSQIQAATRLLRQSQNSQSKEVEVKYTLSMLQDPSATRMALDRAINNGELLSAMQGVEAGVAQVRNQDADDDDEAAFLALAIACACLVLLCLVLSWCYLRSLNRQKQRAAGAAGARYSAADQPNAMAMYQTPGQGTFSFINNAYEEEAMA